mmetsp:Transcript_4692/g.10545  ORF Transcript_4692/g.10545 Transcript_4692/m.10545 type:complete len:85 (-) Transcript_4692:316-570(-)
MKTRISFKLLIAAILMSHAGTMAVANRSLKKSVDPGSIDAPSMSTVPSVVPSLSMFPSISVVLNGAPSLSILPSVSSVPSDTKR